MKKELQNPTDGRLVEAPHRPDGGGGVRAIETGLDSFEMAMARIRELEEVVDSLRAELEKRPAPGCRPFDGNWLAMA